MKYIKGVLITPNQEGTKPREHTLEFNSYKDYYPLLKCDTFEVVTRCFNGHWLDIYCDEEGLFKEHNEASVLTMDKNDKIIEQIVGNAFIVNHDDEGETISLTNEEIKAVLSTVRLGFVKRGLGIKKVCTCVARLY